MDYMIINTALTHENEEQWNDLPMYYPGGKLETVYDEDLEESFETFTVCVFTNRKENNFIVFKWTMIV
jgi:hypothetical protein